MNHRPTSTFMKLTHLPLALITGLLGVSAAFAETVRLDSPDRHLELMAKVMMAMGWIVAYGYFAEIFEAWRVGDVYDRFMTVNRMTGPYAAVFWSLMACNILAPQALWFGRVRRNPVPLFVVALLINVGMWLERFVIVVTSLHRDYLPSSWGMYRPTFWDWSTFLGTMGLFLALLFLFLRLLPAISMSEMRALVSGKEPGT